MKPDTAPDQHALWNGPAGQAWVDGQDLTDTMFAPQQQWLVDAVRADGARRVLDIGCGTGATSWAIARETGAHCRGVDISAAMLAAARQRHPDLQLDVDFLLADAGRDPLHEAPYDAIVSRFGLMFFAEPTSALDHLRHALHKGGRLLALAWRSTDDNPFMIAAERAAAPMLPALPPRLPGAAGQFAFADAEHVQQLLQGSGWQRIQIDAVDFACRLPAVDLPRYLAGFGPVGQALRHANAETRAQVIATVESALTGYIHDGELRYTAACWAIRAHA